MTGQTISHYRILEKIGEGGMGVVYRAEDIHLERSVALKFLHTGQDTARLLREAKTVASLAHPNICLVHEVEPERGFLAMEFIEGRTLKEMIGGRPIPVIEALRLALLIGEGLAAAHAKGIVHRDIKPANIMVTGTGVVKIMDFGLARVAGQVGLTVEGAAAGTPGYMAPEQMRGEPVDRRADIWALGAVLYEMLTGRPPVGQSEVLPEGFGRALRKALAADPSDRYQHVEDLLVDLRQAGSAPAGAPNRRVWLWTAAGTTAATAAGVAIWLAQRVQDTGIRSIAVLPLANLSKDPEQDYFVDGLHEEITALLSKVSGLKVISRTSTLRYREDRKPAQVIGQELKVEGLLEGSVRSVAGEVAITLRLIRAATDEHLWAETYRRSLENVLALQADTARAAVHAIGVALKPVERKALATSRQVNPAAYQAYLRGRQIGAESSLDKQLEARKWFERASQLDPSFALAYVGIADTHFAAHGYLKNPAAHLLKAEEYGAKAVALDPTPQARYSMVNPRGWRTFDWRTTYKVAQEWLADDPNSASAHITIASFYGFAFKDRLSEAIQHARKAVELDPFSLNLDEMLGRFIFLARKYPEAIAHFGGMPARHPGLPRARVVATIHQLHAQALMGNLAESLRLFGLIENKINLTLTAGMLPTLVKLGRAGQVRKLLAAAEEQYADGQLTHPYSIALGHLAVGSTDQTFRWLNIALDELDSFLVFLQVHPWWDPVRNDPRFQAAVRRRFGEVT